MYMYATCMWVYIRYRIYICMCYMYVIYIYIYLFTYVLYIYTLYIIRHSGRHNSKSMTMIPMNRGEHSGKPTTVYLPFLNLLKLETK